MLARERQCSGRAVRFQPSHCGCDHMPSPSGSGRAGGCACHLGDGLVGTPVYCLYDDDGKALPSLPAHPGPVLHWQAMVMQTVARVRPVVCVSAVGMSFHQKASPDRLRYVIPCKCSCCAVMCFCKQFYFRTSIVLSLLLCQPHRFVTAGSPPASSAPTIKAECVADVMGRLTRLWTVPSQWPHERPRPRHTS